MDEHIALMQPAADEVKRLGIHKQCEQVQSSYRHYMAKASKENYAALQHDLRTLRDYNLS